MKTTDMQNLNLSFIFEDLIGQRNYWLSDCFESPICLSYSNLNLHLYGHTIINVNRTEAPRTISKNGTLVTKRNTLIRKKEKSFVTFKVNKKERRRQKKTLARSTVQVKNNINLRRLKANIWRYWKEICFKTRRQSYKII